ncbi:MAG: hypothetical protein R3B45_06410 [Bdellovibrionota bacterium]
MKNDPDQGNNAYLISFIILGRVDVSFPTTSQTLPSCDFQVFVSRYENETSTRPRFSRHAKPDAKNLKLRNHV